MPRTALQSLIRHLEQEYYQPAEQYCRKITECITGIYGGDSDQTASLYTSLCKKLTEHVGYYLKLRRDFLRPYLAGEPSGEMLCDAYCRHQLQAVSVQIQDLIMQLRSVVAPIPHEPHLPGWEEALHRETKKLDECLTGMFYLEQSALAGVTASAGI